MAASSPLPARSHLRQVEGAHREHTARGIEAPAGLAAVRASRPSWDILGAGELTGTIPLTRGLRR
jgi:hypothetical protein